MGTTLLSLQADDMLTSVFHTYVMVGTSSVPIVLENKERRWLVIQNDGAKPVYLSIGSPAVLHRGYLLNPGQTLEQTLCSSNMCGMQINGICSSVNNVLVTEGM